MATPKPYSCELCQSSFSRYKELATHKDFCNKETPTEASVPQGVEDSNITAPGLEDDSCRDTDGVVCAEGNIRNTIYGLIHKSIVKRGVANESQNTAQSQDTDLMMDDGDVPGKEIGCVRKCVCDVCDTVFTDQGTLREHQETCVEQKPNIVQISNNPPIGHRKKLPRKCVELGYHVRVSPWDLEMLMQSQKKVYQCTSCTKSFVRKNSLQAHITQLHSPDAPGTACEICGKRFKNALSMRLHARTHSTEKKNYECDDCGRCFSYERSFQSHLLSHTGKKQYECSECGKCFSRKDNMETHMQCHNDDEKPLHTGELAFDIFDEEDDEEEAAPDVKAEKVVKVKIRNCPYCEKLFKTTGNLKVHLRVHTGEKPFQCSVCGKCFSRNGNLQTHMRSHTGEKPCKCEVCGKAFSHISGLRYHMKNHTNEKPFECTICGKLFKCANGLKYHVENHPPTEKNHICDECGEAFCLSNDLKLHKAVHTGQVLHVCEVCNKQFLHSYNLKVHMGVHSDEKPYKCEQCGKCFKQNGALRIHTRRHMDIQALKKTSTELMSMVDNTIE